MPKSQTSTEYIIIVAVVILLAVTIAQIMSRNFSFGTDAADRELKVKWKVQSPISISRWSAGDSATIIELQNNNPDLLRLNEFELDNLDFTINKVLKTGEIYRIKIPGEFKISKTSFVLNYTILNNDAENIKSSENTLSSLNSESDNLYNGLVGYWKFDRDFSDSSTSKNNGIKNGDASISADYLVLDGIGDYVDVGDDSSIHFKENGTYTYSFWFNLGNNSAYNGLLSDESAGTNGFDIYVETDNRIIIWSTSANDFFTIATSTMNEWNHIAVVYDSETINSYFNGIAAGAGTRIFVDSSGTFQIGNSPDSGASLNGSMDEVMVFNRSLSYTEIEKIFLAGR